MPVAEERLIVFTRLPEAGRSKTRLIPALGEKGAAAYHDRLARHAIGRASAFVMCRENTRLELSLAGGTTMDGRAWLGEGFWRIQAPGGLGEKLADASRTAFQEGASKVVIMGTDCPSLDESGLEAAFAGLDQHEVVIGPAKDGGYYLIGTRCFHRDLFREIPWGGEKVFERTMERAAELGLSVGLLPSLSDVDTPEDLPAAEKVLAGAERVSVIIPAFNEAASMQETLAEVIAGSPAQVLVADGGSSDGTAELAERHGATVLSSRKGRGPQMNQGAAAADGEFLFFVHADSHPPRGYSKTIRDLLNRPGVSAGSFRLGLRGGFGAASLIESLVDLRCQWLSWPYGDQGLFLRRSIFQHLGGFPEEALLEDVGLVTRLRKLGHLELAQERVESSDRRWREKGLIRTFLKHQMLLAGHALRLPLKR